MTSKINSVLKTALESVKPGYEDVRLIESSLRNFLAEIRFRLKKLKISAEPFVGGSFAKRTFIRKDYYDVDVFLRYGKKYSNEDISKLTGNILKGFKNVSVIHGSRDYFRVKFSDNFYIELIPVMKISKPGYQENITDLSYSHVKYINKKIKSQKVLDEVKIAKAFCHANKVYGAESYIKGFSGYSLELLIHHYGSFLKFVRAISKFDFNKNEKLIIDIEKLYKKKKDVLLDMNSSKLISPIILVDPTYKGRNALAALSYETLERFKKVCNKFLKNPSIKYFENRKTDLERIKKDALKKKEEFILLEVKTERQEGDIAGSKLLKFYKHLSSEIERSFEIKKKGFNYNNGKAARYFFVVKSRKEIIFQGPLVNDKKNVAKFKKEHKNTFVKDGKVNAREKVDFSVEEFFKKWVKKHKGRMGEMSVEEIRII